MILCLLDFLFSFHFCVDFFILLFMSEVFSFFVFVCVSSFFKESKTFHTTTLTTQPRPPSPTQPNPTPNNQHNTRPNTEHRTNTEPGSSFSKSWSRRSLNRMLTTTVVGSRVTVPKMRKAHVVPDVKGTGLVDKHETPDAGR